MMMRSKQNLLVAVLAVFLEVASASTLRQQPATHKKRNDHNQLDDDITPKNRRQNARRLINGGEQVDVLSNEFEFFARMDNGRVYCGGALIGQSAVITSASCLETVFGSAGPSVVRLGPPEDEVEYLNVECVRVHPNFSNTGTVPTADLAIVKLKETTDKSPIYDNRALDYPNTLSTLMMLGYGATAVGSAVPSNFLRKVIVPFYPLAGCNSFYNNELTLENHLCAGGIPLEGPCFSDNGGPLVGMSAPNVDDKYTLIGIYSTSLTPCGEDSTGTTPDVFTDVRPFAAWIESELNGVCPTPSPTTNSPTTPTTASPTAAPESSDDIGLPCFSASDTVHVRGKGMVAMKDLQVGQEIFAGYSSRYGMTPLYETVYGFGHVERTRKIDFLRITTTLNDKLNKALEISSNHLIFLDGEQDPVRADSLQVGDYLWYSSLNDEISQKVQIIKIDRQSRQGLYQPLTNDGSIIVNGIHASTYVSVDEIAPEVIDVVKTILSEQSLFHFWVAPYRLVCTKISKELCSNDHSIYDDGIIPWLRFGKVVVELGQQLPVWFVLLSSCVVVAVCALTMMVESFLEGSALLWSMVLVLTVAVGLRQNQRQQRRLQENTIPTKLLKRE